MRVSFTVLRIPQLALLCLVPLGCRGDAPAPLEAETGGPTHQGDGDGDGECPPADPTAWDDPLVHLGRAEGDTFIEILDVVADGSLVYACTATQGLTIWDVTDPMQAKLLVENVGPAGLANLAYPRCQHFTKQPDAMRAVITSRGDEIQPTPWLFLYDISDPQQPQELVGWSGEDHIEGAVFLGDRIVAAAHRSGILVFEDQGGDALALVSSFADSDSDAWLPVVFGDYILAAEGTTGLRTYDFSGPSPTLLATLPLAGSSKDIVVRDAVAFIAGSSSLAAVDVSDPADPALLGQVSTLGTALAVELGEEDILFAAEWDEIRGYDISDPTNMTRVLSETVPVQVATSFTRVLSIGTDAGSGLVFAGEWQGLHVFEQRPLGQSPEIWATPQNVNFGTVEVGDSDDAVIVVHNLGNAPLQISDVVAADPDFQVSTTCAQVPAGGSRAIEASYSAQTDAQSAESLVFVTDDPDEANFTVDLIANVPGLDVGDPAPEFELFDLEGKKWTNADIAGKVTILAYFATF